MMYKHNAIIFDCLMQILYLSEMGPVIMQPTSHPAM